ncbi:MAG: hypothetical protein ACI9AR_000582 [Flavobacteriaceae bacterium]|jgi:hypothetical protein
MQNQDLDFASPRLIKAVASLMVYMKITAPQGFEIAQEDRELLGHLHGVGWY